MSELVTTLQARLKRLEDGYPEHGDAYCDGGLDGFRLCLNRVLIWMEEENNE